MAINEGLVRLSEEQAQRLISLYTDAEREILDAINQALLRGNKTEYLKAMLDNVKKIQQDLLDGSRTWCEEALPQIYIDGGQFADSQLKAAGSSLDIGYGAIHQQAVQVLADNTYQLLENVSLTIGRRADDIYRTMAMENIRGSVAGYETWKQAATRIRERLADKGVTGFQDVAGRNWNMRSYSEMVARTSTMEAHLTGTANRLTEYGRDLVKVSTHAKACPLCLPWQGKILSLTGKTGGYPTLAEAKEKGLFHPNCKHAYGLYINFDEE